jgi:hypothetical protein
MNFTQGRELIIGESLSYLNCVVIINFRPFGSHLAIGFKEFIDYILMTSKLVKSHLTGQYACCDKFEVEFISATIEIPRASINVLHDCSKCSSATDVGLQLNDSELEQIKSLRSRAIERVNENYIYISHHLHLRLCRLNRRRVGMQSSKLTGFSTASYLGAKGAILLLPRE